MNLRIVPLIFSLLFPITTLFAQNKTEVFLSGLDVVPGVQTPATGTAEVWIQSDTLYVEGEFSDLKDFYFAGNIHYGEEGENGNPLYSLRPDLSDDHKSGSFDPEKNHFYVSDAVKEAFENGNLYITVASHRHQRGEIRGQINTY